MPKLSPQNKRLLGMAGKTARRYRTSNSPMVQVIEQTREEKIAMYLKLTKQELAEMLTTANDAIGSGRLSAWPPKPLADRRS